MIEENIYYNYMKDVILKGGGKTILDVDHIIFFYMESEKDLQHINLDSNQKKEFLKNYGFPSMFVDLKSSTYRDQFDLIFPMPTDVFKDTMDNMIKDYKKKKISFDEHTQILDGFVDSFITKNLKNGVFRNTDIKINLLKKTKLSFVNALAHTDKDKKKYFSRFEKKIDHKNDYKKH